MQHGRYLCLIIRAYFHVCVIVSRGTATNATTSRAFRAKQWESKRPWLVSLCKECEATLPHYK